MALSLQHLYGHLKEYKDSHRALYLFSTVVFFWAIFDRILSYSLPLLLEKHGFSSTEMGFIIGSSSIAGAAFDFLMCRLVTEINFRRVFIFMFALSAIFLLLLWNADTLAVYLLAMAVWGFYYDLSAFGTFDFVTRYTDKEDHAASFGIIQVLKSLGCIIGPIIAGILIVDGQIFLGSAIFLAISIVIFIFLIIGIKRRASITVKNDDAPVKPRNLLAELGLWERIGKYIFPALALTFFLYTVDAFFWTIGPIYSETLGLGDFNGLLLAMYCLPSVLVGLFVSKLTKKHGKLKVAYVSFLISSILLSCFALVAAYSSVLVIVLTFLVATMTAISYPSMNGAYADYISDSPVVEKEIEGLEDFFTNAGYVVGPILSGILEDFFGAEKTFSAIGVCGVILAIFLINHSIKRRKIKVKE